MRSMNTIFRRSGKGVGGKVVGGMALVLSAAPLAAALAGPAPLDEGRLAQLSIGHVVARQAVAEQPAAPVAGQDKHAKETHAKAAATVERHGRMTAAAGSKTAVTAGRGAPQVGPLPVPKPRPEPPAMMLATETLDRVTAGGASFVVGTTRIPVGQRTTAKAVSVKVAKVVIERSVTAATVAATVDVDSTVGGE